MGSLKNRYIFGLILLNAVLINVLILTWNIIFTNVISYVWTCGAVAFLFLCELAIILIIDKKSKTVSVRQSINLFMGLKVGKILLSLFFVAIYTIAVKTEVKRFVMVFLGIYLIYLVFDTFYLMSKEKETKIKKTDDEVF